SSSFGLHVAKMAGIPTQVLNDAKRYLIDNLKAENEKTIDDKNELAKSLNDKQQQNHEDKVEGVSSSNTTQTQKSGHNPQQNHLFSLQDELTAINPDNLTPKQAHDLLYHLKGIISQ